MSPFKTFRLFVVLIEWDISIAAYSLSLPSQSLSLTSYSFCSASQHCLMKICCKRSLAVYVNQSSFTISDLSTYLPISLPPSLPTYLPTYQNWYKAAQSRSDAWSQSHKYPTNQSICVVRMNDVDSSPNPLSSLFLLLLLLPTRQPFPSLRHRPTYLVFWSPSYRMPSLTFATTKSKRRL